MNKFGKAIVKLRVPILIISILLLIPAAIGFLKTRVNYDVLSYLPKDIETMKGQDILADDFGTGAFSLCLVEGMDDKDVVKLKKQMEQVDNVDSVIWYDSIMDISIPDEILPKDIREAYRNDDCTMMAIIFKTTMSSDETMEAITQIRKLASKQCFISGMSAVVTDTKDLCDKEVPIYVTIAVILSLIVLSLTMDSFLVPIFFLLSIGMAIVYNLGTNVFKGEISYITQALTAVLQLGVTMDYSIFLWHSYQEEKKVNGKENKEAMADAIASTFSSVIGSSITTVAGFVALCFMTFTLGLDLGIVMAKGVVIGVICCVTVLPSMILIFDKPIEKTCHRSLLPKFDKLSKFIVNKYWIFHILFLILLVPALYGYTHTDVYYNLDSSLPEDLPSIQANQKLEEEFNMNSTHMILLDSNLDEKSINKVISEIKTVKGVKTVLGLESVVGPMIPQSMIPQDLKSKLDNGEWKLMLVMSEYKVASDEVNTQCDEINTILHKYDSKGMLIGEAPCTKDLIEITDKDFNTVSTVSIGVILLIILFVFKSVSLPIILVCVIEFAIFINMGIPAFTNTTLPFIASIVIGTIQLGSTVDYAILMTTRYKRERSNGLAKKEAVTVALQTSMISIIVSALSFFAATFGVGCYSEIDMISSLCTLMARGAIISMFVVIFLLPAALMLFDKLIIHTTIGFKGITGKQKVAYAGAGNVDPASEQKTADDDDFLNEDRPFAKKKSGNFDNYDFDDSYSDDDKYIDVNNDFNGPADRQ